MARKIKKFDQFLNEDFESTPSIETQEETSEPKFMYNASLFIEASSEEEAEKILLDIQEQSGGKIELGFYALDEQGSGNEEHEEDVVEEGFKDFFKKVDPAELQKSLEEKYDTAAQAYLKGVLEKNPKADQNIYKQEFERNKSAAVAGAIKRSKEMGAKEGNFIFVSNKGKLIVQYEQGNKIPSMAGGLHSGS